MTKVECLHEILVKLAGKDISAAGDDTVCELLDKMIPYIGDSNVSKPEDVSELFNMEGIEGNITTTLLNIYVKKVGNLYNARVKVDLNIGTRPTVNTFVAFKLNIPNEIKDFRGTIGPAFLLDSVNGKLNHICNLQISESVDGKSDGIVWLEASIPAGNYQLNAEFMFMQGVD